MGENRLQCAGRDGPLTPEQQCPVVWVFADVFPWPSSNTAAVSIPAWGYFSLCPLFALEWSADSWQGSFLLDLFVGMTPSPQFKRAGPCITSESQSRGFFPDSQSQVFDQGSVFKTYTVSSLGGHEHVLRGQEKSGLMDQTNCLKTR